MAKGVDKREQVYQANRQKWGTWTASAMDGWMCPTAGWAVMGVTYTCDGKHRAGDCNVARQMGQAAADKGVKL